MTAFLQGPGSHWEWLVVELSKHSLHKVILRYNLKDKSWVMLHCDLNGFLPLKVNTNKM